MYLNSEGKEITKPQDEKTMRMLVNAGLVTEVKEKPVATETKEEKRVPENKELKRRGRVPNKNKN